MSEGSMNGRRKKGADKETSCKIVLKLLKSYGRPLTDKLLSIIAILHKPINWVLSEFSCRSIWLETVALDKKMEGGGIIIVLLQYCRQIKRNELVNLRQKAYFETQPISKVYCIYKNILLLLAMKMERITGIEHCALNSRHWLQWWHANSSQITLDNVWTWIALGDKWAGIICHADFWVDDKDQSSAILYLEIHHNYAFTPALVVLSVSKCMFYCLDDRCIVQMGFLSMFT